MAAGGRHGAGGAAACEAGGGTPQATTTTPLTGGRSPVTYLSDALDLIQANAYYADRVNWPSVRAEAQRRVAAATSTADTYETLRWVLSKLGDHHSFLLTPDQAHELTAVVAAASACSPCFPSGSSSTSSPGAARNGPGYGWATASRRSMVGRSAVTRSSPYRRPRSAAARPG
jgi:hypothetical protein